MAAECVVVILGGTELPLDLTEAGCGVRLVDTARILLHAALDFAALPG